MVVFRIVDPRVDHVGVWATISMTLSSRAMLVVKVVTLESILVEDFCIPILSVDDGVACIIIHNRAFLFVYKHTTTPRHILPVYVQQGNIPVHSVTKLRSELLEGLCGCRARRAQNM